MLRRGGSKRLSSPVLAIEHVREMDAGLDRIQRNLLIRLKALLASLSPDDPMHERLRDVLEALEESLLHRVPLTGGRPPDDPGT